MSGTGDLRQKVFALRSYTPIPFLVAMVVFAAPTLGSLIVGGAIVILGKGSGSGGCPSSAPRRGRRGVSGGPTL